MKLALAIALTKTACIALIYTHNTITSYVIMHHIIFNDVVHIPIPATCTQEHVQFALGMYIKVHMYYKVNMKGLHRGTKRIYHEIHLGIRPGVPNISLMSKE